MAKTLGIGILIIIIAGAAYYVGVMQKESAITAQTETTASTTTSDASMTGEYGEVDSVMVGTWRSTEDEKFTREFKADGTVTDRYEGDEAATESATFATIDPSVIEVPGVPAASLAGMTVIRVDFESGPMFFSINSMTETELVMTNLSGRGNILSFTKVQ